MALVLILLSSLLLTTRAAAAASNAVLDVDGDPVQSGRLYRLMSVFSPYEGLTLVSPNGSCPLNVAPDPLNKLSGDPLTFIPESGEATVRERDTLYIMFAVPTQCPESTVWKLGRSGSPYVTTGGTSSKIAGPHDSRFAIYPVGDSWTLGYQFEVCPCSRWSVGPPGPACLLPCEGALGLAEGQKRGDFIIAVGTNLPLTVNFVKAFDNQESEKNFVTRSAALRRPYSVN